MNNALDNNLFSGIDNLNAFHNDFPVTTSNDSSENMYNNENMKCNLSICHLNVYGNLASKLECTDFSNKFKTHDIVFFSETWSNSKSKLVLDGFDKPICKHRVRKKKCTQRFRRSLHIF